MLTRGMTTGIDALGPGRSAELGTGWVAPLEQERQITWRFSRRPPEEVVVWREQLEAAQQP
jgi:hypothetical protein